MEVVRLSITEEIVQITSGTDEVVRVGTVEEIVRVSGVSEVGPRGPKGDAGEFSPDSVVAVIHGDDPDYPRPAGPRVVFWFGTVIPNQMQDFDNVFIPSTVIV